MANRGYVYVLVNPALPGTVKIGLTKRDPKLRARELSNTSVPQPYQVAYCAEVRDCIWAERIVHSRLRENRIGKEFFRVGQEEAVDAVRSAVAYVNQELALPLPLAASPTRDRDVVPVEHKIYYEDTETVVSDRELKYRGTSYPLGQVSRARVGFHETQRPSFAGFMGQMLFLIVLLALLGLGALALAVVYPGWTALGLILALFGLFGWQEFKGKGSVLYLDSPSGAEQKIVLRYASRSYTRKIARAVQRAIDERDVGR